MASTQALARSFPWINMGIGPANLVGPTVTWQREPHSQIACRAPGRPARNQSGRRCCTWDSARSASPVPRTRGARWYWCATAAPFDPITAGGFAVVRKGPEVYFLVGMALDRSANYIAWTLPGAAHALPGRPGPPPGLVRAARHVVR